MHVILLYYKYVPISDPAKLRQDQLLLCQKLDLKGRIIVSKEGINGTVEGEKENVQKYIAHMRADERFMDVDFKESIGTGKAFPRLSVRVRPEIVTLGTGSAKFKESGDFKKGTYLSPDELQKWYEDDKDFVVIDMRNDYEYSVGHFENSLLMPAENFRDIPKAVEKILAEHPELKDETVVPVCTGGVRCEKASAYLIEKGFKDVYQLHGGIVRYLEKHPGKKFKGSLYVFDGRVVVNYDSPEQHTVVGKCKLCGTSSERCMNCENLDCHGHFICCENCSEGGIFCSNECRESAILKGRSLAHNPF